MRLAKLFDKPLTILKGSKDRKTLVENFSYLALLQVASYAFPLITMPYLARVIGVTGFGEIAFAMAVMVWIQTFVDWGFGFTATRDVAVSRDDKQRVSEIFSNVLWARLLLMLASFVLLVVLILAIPKFYESKGILLVSFLMVPGHILFPSWFFQGMERMKFTTILNVVSKLVFTIAVFFVIRSKEDYILQPLLTSLGYIVAGVIALYIIIYKWHVRILRPNMNSIIDCIKKSTDVFINNLMPNLYNSYSVLILGFFGGSAANGKLDAGSKVANIGLNIMTVLGRTFFPFLSRRPSAHGKYAKMSIALATVLTLLTFVFAPPLVKLLFTDEFSESVTVLRIMSLSVFFLTLSTVYGTNYLIVNHHERELRNLTTIASLCGFALSVPLVYYYGFIGAAVNITLTRAFLGVGSMALARKIENNA